MLEQLLVNLGRNLYSSPFNCQRENNVHDQDFDKLDENSASIQKMNQYHDYDTQIVLQKIFDLEDKVNHLHHSIKKIKQKNLMWNDTFQDEMYCQKNMLKQKQKKIAKRQKKQEKLLLKIGALLLQRPFTNFSVDALDKKINSHLEGMELLGTKNTILLPDNSKNNRR